MTRRKLRGISFSEAIGSDSQIEKGEGGSWLCGGVPILFDGTKNTRSMVDQLIKRIKEQQDARS